MTRADNKQMQGNLEHYFQITDRNIRILLWVMLFVTAGFRLDATTAEDRAARVAAKVAPRLQTEIAEKNLLLGAPVYMRIFKESNELELWMRGKEKNGEYVLFRNYRICYWSGTLGPKLKQGDKQAPEGFYQVTSKQLNPHSRYHLSFDLGYPNEYDKGKKSSGNYLMVHGNCVSIGCYAMGNDNIEEIYTIAAAALKNGQENFAVHCFPFRMTKARMLQEDFKTSKWLPLWQDLHKAYQLFEIHLRPPAVIVKNGHHIIKDANDSSR